MPGEITDYKPSLMDKTLLVGHRVKTAFKINKSSVLFVCEGKRPHLMLKCSIGGNVKFHRIEAEDIPGLQEAFRRAQDQLTAVS